jgi:alkylated DNA repair dioxygenase AlkB
LSWPNSPAEQLSVTITDGVAQLLSGDEVWTERKLGRRGRWYAANLDQPKTQQQAIAIARANCPQALSQAVLLPTGRSKLDGSGLIVLEKTKKDLSRFLAVQGDVYLPLQEGAQIVTRLDQDYFRRWVAIAALDKQIPDIYETETKVSAPRPPVVVSNEIEGLRVIPEFLSTEQERGLVSTVNAASWSTELKRRVQHYGWKYDYRARKISASAYLGPLPDWAQTLAQRLFDEGLMPEIADQVIVNEYVLQQGISKHIDCLDCFRGPVVTISLLESWQMTFRKASEKFDLVLKQRSATIIDGAARYEWTHEIPARRYEGEALRSRRISLTFRKVNL